MNFLTSFYHKEEGFTTVQLGIFTASSHEEARVAHIRFFVRKQDEIALIVPHLNAYELTEDTAHVLITEQTAGILDDDFIELLVNKWDKTDLALEYYIKD